MFTLAQWDEAVRLWREWYLGDDESSETFDKYWGILVQCPSLPQLELIATGKA